MQSFTTSEVKKIVSISQEALAKLVSLGYCKPSVQRLMRSAGKATTNLYSKKDLLQITVFKLLSEKYGIKRKYAYFLSNEIDIERWDDLTGGQVEFCLIRETYEFNRMPEEVSDQFRFEAEPIIGTSIPLVHLKGVESAIILNLGQIKKHLERRIEDASKK